MSTIISQWMTSRLPDLLLALISLAIYAISGHKDRKTRTSIKKS